VDEYLSEKEQIERIRQWWSENGRSVITGLVLGFGALFGWRAYVDYRENMLANASAAYEDLVDAVDAKERDRALELATQIEDEYARTPYAMQASLVLARMYMEADEPEQAANELQKVVDRARDAELANIARLRLARVRLYQQQADVALKTLGEEMPGEFAPLFHEARGDALLALGRADEARAQYEQALAGLEPGLANRALIEMKLNDIAAPPADAPAEQATPSEAGS
jgi:predicted negative regulator of RcsB-dependent stress response